MAQMPKDAYTKAKPDFMIAAPRLIMRNTIELEDVDEASNNDNDPVKALDPRLRPTIYYRSRKLLGRLYRNIDERQFLDDMQKQHAHHTINTAKIPLMKAVWSYVQQEMKLIQWAYQLQTARDIREV
jgi:hypothetical protein